MVLLILLTVQLPAISPGDLAHSAEKAIQEALAKKDQPEESLPLFQTALTLYEGLVQQGDRTPALYRNIGNLYLILDRVPEAILAYHQGLDLRPNDPLLRQNLSIARERVVYSEDGFSRPATDNRPPWLPRLHLRGWVVRLIWLMYVGGWIVLARWGITRHKPWLIWGMALPAVAGLLLGAMLLMDHFDRPDTERPWVVIKEDGVQMRKGNSALYPPAHPSRLNRGVEARALFRQPGWVQIELGSGEIGWVPTGSVLIQPTR